MRTKLIGQIIFLFAVQGTAFAAGDIAPSVNIPSSADAVQVQPTGKLSEGTRMPRRDTRSPLFCSSADAAPKLADRVAEGSCRSHTGEHNADAQKSQVPWVPTTDIHAITGR